MQAMHQETLDLLLTRRSVKAAMLAEPGPTPDQLTTILTAAARVPDHKKLEPWRFIVFEGEARAAFGRVLLEACAAEEKEPPSAARLEIERTRLLRAPTVVAVISRVTPNPGGARVGAGAVLRRRVLQPVPGGQRDGLRHLLDHRVVRLQRRRALGAGLGRQREGRRLHLHRHGQASGSPIATGPS